MPRPQFRLRSLFILTAIVAVGCLVGRSKVPDGKLIHVSQKSGAVWINIGQADGLRRKVTFGVVDADKTLRRYTPTKGHIEVVKLLGPHFAECRILDDEITDPLVPGDKIFAPSWHRGRSEGFADDVVPDGGGGTAPRKMSGVFKKRKLTQRSDSAQ